MEKNMLINILADVVPKGKRAVCVFTKQKNYLDLRKDDVSKSGIWKVKKSKMIGIKIVVIYRRYSNRNEIIIGDYFKIISSKVPGRFYLLFRNYRKVGHTINNWKVFAKTGSYPVKYFP
jgi:hypothetical protein